MAHQARAYPVFCSMKQLRVFLLPPGWDASPSQGYPQHKVCRRPFIHLGGERHCESKVSCLRTQHNVPQPGLKPGPLAPESSTLTMRPLHLPCLHVTSFKISCTLLCRHLLAHVCEHLSRDRSLYIFQHLQ